MIKRGFFWLVLLLLLVCFVYGAKVDNKAIQEIDDKGYSEVIVKYKEKIDINGLKEIKQARTLSVSNEEVLTEEDIEITREYNSVNAVSARVNEKGLDSLRDNPDVEEVVVLGLKRVLLTESVPLINGDDARNVVMNSINITGKGETVCVVDTGIKNSHTAFSGRILDEYCYCSLGGACCPNGQAEDTNAEDDHGHGTHVAGIAAGNHSVYRGVAPDAGIVVMKVCSSGGYCQDSDINAGIDWCVSNSSKFNISVISISLGDNSTIYNDYCPSDAAKPFIDAAVAKNISVVIASGNDGWTNGIGSSACVANATSVGSVDDGSYSTTADAISSFTNRGNILDLMAPGKWITSPYYTTDTATIAGTSQATPHVSGAILLLKQFLRLQNGTDLTPAQAEDILNRTGKQIYDSGSGRYYSRIDVIAAIRELDTLPVINFTNSSPLNGSLMDTGYAIINISSDKILTSAWIEFNGTNTTMNGSSTDWYTNLTGDLVYNYTVFGNDAAGNVGQSETRVIYFTNAIPSIDNLTISSLDTLNRTNGTISADYILTDANGHNITNETNWYNNSVLVNSFANTTSVHYNYTKKNENWTFSVRAYDGYNYSAWSNVTIRIINALPTITVIANITVNETQLVNISVNASDIDEDSLTYYIDNGNFTQNLSNFVWNTTLNDSGTYTLNFTVADDEGNSSILAYVIVMDAIDSDSDGIPDFIDTDDDNDGLNDTDDFVLGNSSNINSTVNLTLFVNGTSNLSKVFNSSFVVNVTYNNFTVMEFNWTFNSSNVLNFYNLTVRKQANGSVNGSLLIRGLRLQGNRTKTVYVDRIANISYVCLKDAELSSLSEVTPGCNASNEVFLHCDGTYNGSYMCNVTANNTKYKIVGLNHSGIVEQCQDNDGDGYGTGCLLGVDYCDSNAAAHTSAQCNPPAVVTTTSSGGGGGSGGGSVSKPINISSELSIFEWNTYSKPFFEFEDEQHRIFIDRYDAEILEVSIYSERQVFKVRKGKSVLVDLNSDNKKDIEIYYFGMLAKKAKAGIKLLVEGEGKELKEKIIESKPIVPIKNQSETKEVFVEEEKQPIENERNYMGVVIIIIIVILAIIIFIPFLHKKRRIIKVHKELLEYVSTEESKKFPKKKIKDKLLKKGWKKEEIEEAFRRL